VGVQFVSFLFLNDRRIALFKVARWFPHLKSARLSLEIAAAPSAKLPPHQLTKLMNSCGLMAAPKAEDQSLPYRERCVRHSKG